MYNFLKKGLLFIVAVILLSESVYIPEMTYAADAAVIDKSEIKNGIIIVDYNNETTSLVRITKDSSKYIYDLSGEVRVPLQLGNGDYKIEVLENIEGNKYRQVAAETINYNDDNGKTVFLQSNEIVNWNSDMASIKKAKALTQNAVTDTEKVAAIYSYIVKNIKYDYEKAETVQNGYVPAIDDVYTAKEGICYDYAVLFAAMLRSVGIPMKVLMGTSTDVTEYHAWNQVYMKDTKKWITIDTTIDAALKTVNMDKMAKKVSHYSIEKQY